LKPLGAASPAVPLPPLPLLLAGRKRDRESRDLKRSVTLLSSFAEHSSTFALRGWYERLGLKGLHTFQGWLHKWRIHNAYIHQQISVAQNKAIPTQKAPNRTGKKGKSKQNLANNTVCDFGAASAWKIQFPPLRFSGLVPLSEQLGHEDIRTFQHPSILQNPLQPPSADVINL